jgi:protein-S-isoprenylcysteine O-methyltransferase Ste14
MTIYIWVVVACWAAFIIYWAISWTGTKRTVGISGFKGWFATRIVLIVIVVIILSNQGSKNWALQHFSATTPSLAPLGALLAIIGIGIAIWARRYLGKNWGTPQSVKENPELVTTGPYVYIRHPIYSGVLLAMIGTALVTAAIWFVILVIAAGYFIYSAYQEQKLMLKTFPDTYPAYKARTKMLIPFVF